MPDFIRVREGDQTKLSLQVFKPTGSITNLSITAGSLQGPRWLLTKGTGLSTVRSARSGAGNGRVLRSTNAASGKFFVSINASVLSGLTPQHYQMVLEVRSIGYSGQVLNEYRVGFLVLEGQA